MKEHKRKVENLLVTVTGNLPGNLANFVRKFWQKSGKEKDFWVFESGSTGPEGLILTKLCTSIEKEHTNNIRIRRMYAFQDYMEKQKQFKENAMLIVTLYGEAVVDQTLKKGFPVHVVHINFC